MGRLLGLAFQILFFCTVQFAGAEVVHGPVINPANGHAYFLLKPATWSMARLEAEKIGGYLVTINDASECKWIYENFCNFQVSQTPTWIGLTDQ